MYRGILPKVGAGRIQADAWGEIQHPRYQNEQQPAAVAASSNAGGAPRTGATAIARSPGGAHNHSLLRSRSLARELLEGPSATGTFTVSRLPATRERVPSKIPQPRNHIQEEVNRTPRTCCDAIGIPRSDAAPPKAPNGRALDHHIKNPLPSRAFS
jgi:hypothetical protein